MTAMTMDAAIALYAGHVDWKEPERVRDPEVFKRFHEHDPSCLVCFRRPVHAHHLLGRAQGGGDVEENLIPLCALHHDALHSSTPDRVFVTAALRAYLEDTAMGEAALIYLRSKRSDGWIGKRFGVEL